MGLKRKMHEGDVKLLRKCVRYNGKDWVLQVLCVWYGGVDFDLLRKEMKVNRKRWTNQKLGALRFLRDVTRDYTPNCIASALAMIGPGGGIWIPACGNAA